MFINNERAIVVNMKRLAIKNNILEDAIGAFYREAGVQLNVVEQKVVKDDKRIDAIIHVPGVEGQLIVEIKKWAPHKNLGALIHQMQNLAPLGKGLLVADYINPVMGGKLKEAGVQFIDMAGNGFINQPPIYIYIKGNKIALNREVKRLTKTGKAFQPTGMKVIFAFLTNRKMINAPYRDIAKQAQVALGAVGWVIRDLVTQGFLREGLKNGHRELVGFDQLFDKWVENYPYKLREKQKIGLFTTDNTHWWKTIDLTEFDGRWGGEVAAAKYTNYLNPKNTVVYLNKLNMGKLLQAGRLRKIAPNEYPEVRVELIEPFWEQTNNTGETIDLVHPVLVYADLVETGDPRNLEVANRIREKYLR